MLGTLRDPSMHICVKIKAFSARKWRRRSPRPVLLLPKLEGEPTQPHAASSIGLVLRLTCLIARRRAHCLAHFPLAKAKCDRCTFSLIMPYEGRRSARAPQLD